ncbi:serine protease [Nocardia cyriacigeorgica]|uniref:serine protease n=1 Tax=Nocardia cyriacigeorgica TaxID=135487 RepID=UPI00189306E8|nr:serine protease [Nocardia cyriacigeorgica]MBF6081304.1 serine protease [Nocardia cyriacigeorgica]
MFGKILLVLAAAILGLAGTAIGSAQAAPPVVLGGGSGIVFDDGATCSLATIGWDDTGRMVGFTAGHCNQPGAGVSAESNPEAGPVGTIDYVNKELDYAVIRIDADKVVPVNRVGATTITEVGLPAQFPAIACKQGRTTGQTCGLVYGDVFDTATWTLTQICVLVGDSGGPVVVGTTLVALVNGYVSVPCLGPHVGVNFTRILDDVALRGGLGTGFRPV